jgi:hypothetical protein
VRDYNEGDGGTKGSNGRKEREKGYSGETVEKHIIEYDKDSYMVEEGKRR